MIIFLDTGVLGVLASPNDKQEVKDCQQWLYSLTTRAEVLNVEKSPIKSAIIDSIKS